MTKDQLLAVLDMSEDEQRIEIAKYLPEQKTHRIRGAIGATICDKCEQEVWNDTLECEFITPYEGSLADLAFRLRDEVKGSEGHESWSLGQRIVYDYCVFLPENRPGWEYSQKQAELYDDQKPFFADKAKPIHWIIAALIAKESEVKNE